MEYIILFLLFLVPSITQLANDPAPGFTGSKEESRRLECQRMTTEAAHRRYPGYIVEPGPRGDYIDRSAVICAERLMPPGARPARDEAILSTLEATASGFAVAVDALRPELTGRTWIVDTFYPSPVVAAKVSFATKNALVRRGFRVSDRVPILAGGDIDVIARMPPATAYALACQRYFAEGELGPENVFLGIVLRDTRETVLHIGLCADAEWRWLR